MIFFHDPDEWETVSHFVTCPFHEQHPGEPYAGCTCSGSMSQQKRPPEQVAAIKAQKQREHEDKILAEAEQIKARRGVS